MWMFYVCVGTMTRILVSLVLSAVYINCAVLTGKAFYCRDPDTGKLHAVNTTWAASSFCGNYTCNIRKRNISSSTSIRQFNVTDVNIEDRPPNVTERVTVTIEKRIEPNLLTILHKAATPDYKNVIDKSSNKVVNIIPSDDYYDQLNSKPKGTNCKLGQNIQDENDRYLTEKEIESIAEMLHTVKRSDLDAIVDIYNLAQDIYEEMDEVTTKELMNAGLSVTKEEVRKDIFNTMKEEDLHTNRNVKEPSYWYDPLAHKGRISERYDTNVHKTFHITTTEKPQTESSNPFNGRLLSEIGKTPFYYPVTQFQRISSYTRPTYPSYRAITQHINVKKQSEEVREDVRTKNINDVYKADSRKLIQPSHYLPYPFTNIHPYNLTETRNVYYGSPWMLDYYNRYKYYQPYYSAYIGPYQKAVLINPHLNSEVQDIEQHIVEQPVELTPEKSVNEDVIDTLFKGHMIPSWKTDPVPVEVLKDIRADIDTSRLLKAFPLRKKIRLERVGKLINMDDLNSQLTNRGKRFASKEEQKDNVTENLINTDVEEYETYLEKVTCQDQIRLGYFRIGNLTQPYPGCCPQLIDTR